MIKLSAHTVNTNTVNTNDIKTNDYNFDPPKKSINLQMEFGQLKGLDDRYGAGRFGVGAMFEISKDLKIVEPYAALGLNYEGGSSSFQTLSDWHYLDNGYDKDIFVNDYKMNYNQLEVAEAGLRLKAGKDFSIGAGVSVGFGNVTTSNTETYELWEDWAELEVYEDQGGWVEDLVLVETYYDDYEGAWIDVYEDRGEYVEDWVLTGTEITEEDLLIDSESYEVERKRENGAIINLKPNASFKVADNVSVNAFAKIPIAGNKALTKQLQPSFGLGVKLGF